MKRKFVEVAIRTQADTSELPGLLDSNEFSGSWEEAGILHIYWPEDTWSDAVRADIARCLNRLGIGVRDADTTVTVIEDQDWNAVWAASLEPVRVGRSIRIRQSWHPRDAAFDGIELVLDPRRAFGTGYHATTRMVIEWLEENIQGGEAVLDIGTGSGILSMVALRLNAASALAVDIDAAALECAREYAEVNGFGPELEFRAASFEDLASAGYDTILANLDGRALPSLCRHMSRLMKPGGIACFSGLQHQDYEEIAGALSRAGIRIAAHRQRDDWLALELKRDV